MKYIKLFMLLAVASLFAACSDDDDNVNSATATVSLSQDTITVKENTGYFNVPIALTGARNGDVKVTVTVTPAATNPAVDDTNYLVTDKTITIPSTDSTANVQIKTVDDTEINENRSFTLTITAEGATLGNSKTVVVLRDNDAAFYEKFFGKWMLTGTSSNGKVETPIKCEVTITGETDEAAKNYDKILTCEAPNMLNVGIALSPVWHFRYSFDKSSKTGSLGFIMGEQVASYGANYSWIFVTDDGTNYTTDDVTATWALGSDGSFPTEITFPADKTIYLYQPGAGAWRMLYDFKMTKE